MPPIELDPNGYKRENIPIKIGEMAGSTYILLKTELETATDEESILNVLETRLDGFIEGFNQLHNIKGVIDPENPVMLAISYDDKRDLPIFKEKVRGIEDLLEGVKGKIPDYEYKKYSQKLNDILLKTGNSLTELEGDNQQIAA
jgi:hypothetical protein